MVSTLIVRVLPTVKPMFYIYAGTKNIAITLAKLVRGKGNDGVKAELVDKSKCRTILTPMCVSLLCYLILL